MSVQEYPVVTIGESIWGTLEELAGDNPVRLAEIAEWRRQWKAAA